MSDIKWLPRAHSARENAIDYIAAKDPLAALSQLDEIETQVGLLAQFHSLGRNGRKPGTRELVINRTPFLVVYRVIAASDVVQILSFLHGAQRWPSKDYE